MPEARENDGAAESLTTPGMGLGGLGRPVPLGPLVTCARCGWSVRLTPALEGRVKKALCVCCGFELEKVPT